MKNITLVSAPGLTLTLALAMASGDAAAVTQGRTLAGNANAWCNGALPSFEGNLRKRPLAVQNEGAAIAFVTCTFIVQNALDDDPPHTLSRVKVWAASFDSEAHMVSCTGVSGFNTGPNQSIVKSANLNASNGQASMIWNAADFSGAPTVFPSGLFSISCMLEPGSGLNDMYVTFSEDVGA